MAERDKTIAEYIEDAIYEHFPGPREQGPRPQFDQQRYELHSKPMFRQAMRDLGFASNDDEDKEPRKVPIQ